MKTLLVLGASSEIGSALIRRVSGGYDTVWAYYRSWNDALEELSQTGGDRLRFVQADLSEPEEIAGMIREIRSSGAEPDHIVHLPMTKFAAQKFKKLQWADFDAGWELSVRSAVLVAQAFLPHMQQQRAGKLVFMLSSVTADTPPGYQAAYVTVKYALLGLMKSLAAEYADKGIQINGVSPDMIRTRYLANLPPLLVEQYAQTRPSGRILEVEDVVPTLAFLLSAEADHINGENLCIRA